MATRTYQGYVYAQGPDGSWQRQGPATPQMPADPTFPMQAPKMQADIGKTVADTARTQTQIVGDQLANQKAQREIAQNPISDKDQDFINKLRDQAGAIPETIGTIRSSAQAIDRFQPSQSRGTLYGMFQAEDNDWPTTAAFKGIGRNFLDDQAMKDYETLKALQEKQVLNTQIAQKGPQTESDAARMKLSQIAPNKSVEANSQLIGEAMYNARLSAYKPSFYTKWANKFGSINATNSDGKTADDVWTEVYQKHYPKGMAFRGPGKKADAPTSRVRIVGDAD